MSERDIQQQLRDAYEKGFKDGGNQAKSCPGSFVVIFEQYLLDEEKIRLAELLGSIRGVVAIVPVEQSHRGYLQWEELARVLGADPCDSHAHEYALAQAGGAAESLRQTNVIWKAFWDLGTEEQKQKAFRFFQENDVKLPK